MPRKSLPPGKADRKLFGFWRKKPANLKQMTSPAQRAADERMNQQNIVMVAIIAALGVALLVLRLVLANM